MRNLAIWALLVAATCGSGILGTHSPARTSGLLPIAIILFIAITKVRFVMMEFMEIRGAPLALRTIGTAWLAGAFMILLGLYVFLGAYSPIQA